MYWSALNWGSSTFLLFLNASKPLSKGSRKKFFFSGPATKKCGHYKELNYFAASLTMLSIAEFF